MKTFCVITGKLGAGAFYAGSVATGLGIVLQHAALASFGLGLACAGLVHVVVAAAYLIVDFNAAD